MLLLRVSGAPRGGAPGTALRRAAGLLLGLLRPLTILHPTRRSWPRRSRPAGTDRLGDHLLRDIGLPRADGGRQAGRGGRPG